MTSPISPILLLTPLPLENAALRTAMEACLGRARHIHPAPKLSYWLFSDAHLSLAVGGHGKVEFALQCERFISLLSPRLVVCAGSCGSLARQGQGDADHVESGAEAGIGDVVAATETIEHDFLLNSISSPLPRFPGAAAWLQALRSRWEREGAAGGFSVHFARMASGDEDILNLERAREVRKKTEALAVAWEGAGGARACRFHSVPFLECRVATDYAGPGLDETFRFEERLLAGAPNLAKVLSSLVETNL